MADSRYIPSGLTPTAPPSGAGSPRHHYCRIQGAGRIGFYEIIGLQFGKHEPCFCPQRPLSGHFISTRLSFAAWKTVLPALHLKFSSLHLLALESPGRGTYQFPHGARSVICPGLNDSQEAGRKARTAADSNRHTRVHRVAPVTKHSTISPTDGQSLNHRMVWDGRDIKDHVVPILCHGQVSLSTTQLALNSSSNGEATASLGNMSQWFTTVTGKDFFLMSNLKLFSFHFKALPLVLSLSASVK